jgi:hypothetical protein
MRVRRSVWFGIVAAAWMAMAGSMAGCASAPAVAPLQAPAGETLPLAVRVAVDIDPSVPDLASSEYSGYHWRYPLASIMRQAALNVFQRAFREAGPLASNPQPTITLLIKGTSSINPLMGDYYGQVTAVIFPGADISAKPAGEYNSEGKASATIYSTEGVRLAFEAAFTRLANKMLADPQFLEQLRASPAR